MYLTFYASNLNPVPSSRWGFGVHTGILTHYSEQTAIQVKEICSRVVAGQRSKGKEFL